ncbi:MAG TPA: SURF1 family protein [Ilumatobacter sp.]
MYRFLLRPAWIAFHLLVALVVVTMVNLGSWQLRRLDERQAFNTRVEQRYDAVPVPIDELLTASADPDAIEWRPVTVSGSYLVDGTIEIVNRSQGGRAGLDLVVPLLLDDGRVVLVNRGFVVLADDRTPPPVPAVEVAVTGRLRASQTRGFGQLADAATGELLTAQRIDLERLAAQMPGELLPMYVDLTVSDPPEPVGGPVPVALPELTEGNHLSYAVQWFIFSIAVVAGWVLAVRRSIATRRAGPPAVPPADAV